MHNTCLALSLPLLLSTLAHAASFDCTKAATPQEKAICATPDLSAADEQMASAYKAWMAAAQPDWAAEIRDDQRVWLRVRTTSCPAGDASNPIEPCLRQVYQARIDQLQQRVKTFWSVTFVSRSVTLTVPDELGSLSPGVTELTPGFGTFEAAWPQVSLTTPQWTAWNNAIKAAAIQADYSATGNTQKPPPDWNGLVKPEVDEQLNVTIDGFNGKMISAAILDDYDGHGAHPDENSYWFHWLLDPERELKAVDVFRPNSGWDTWMEKHLDSYLHQTLDSQSLGGNYQTEWFPQGNAPQVLESIVTNPERWQLNAKGLTLVFQPYEVACYACTPAPLTISWSDLKPYLQPSFILPQ